MADVLVVGAGVAGLTAAAELQRAGMEMMLETRVEGAALYPGGYPPINAYALALTRVGRAEEAIPLFQKGIRLNPFGPSPIYITFGRALRTTGRFEEAVSAYKKAIKLTPHFIDAHVGLAATYIMMGSEKEARAEAAEILRIIQSFQWIPTQRE